MLSIVIALVVIACGDTQHGGIGTSPNEPTMVAPADDVAAQVDAGIDAAD